MDFNETQKAAERGDANAQYQLALCYAQGIGVEKNPSNAVFWCEKAVDQGHADAAKALAGLLKEKSARLMELAEEQEEKVRKMEVARENGSWQATKPSSSGGGCYIATAVYGSYNCPQVWTLRRYRDNSLARTACGRALIKAYYAMSPSLVKRFGTMEWFQHIWKRPLDAFVARLHAGGVENTPYIDRPR
jgi:TPR repeat protein